MKHPGVFVVGLAVLALWLAAAGARAADGTEPAGATGTAAAAVARVATQPAAAGFPMGDAGQDEVWILWGLTALAAAGGLLALGLVFTCRERRVVPRVLVGEIVARTQAGEMNAARHACEERPCPLSAVALVLFDLFRQAPRNGIEVLRDAVAAETRRQAEALLAPVRWLRDLAVLALLMGALGTVLGLMQTFGGAPRGDAAGELPAWGPGVAQALAATAFGLLIALGTATCHAWFHRRAKRHGATLAVAAAEILLALVGRYER